MDRTANGLPPERLIQVFEQGFAVVWQRVHQTLGDVTLTAIVDRVLYTAVEQYPFFSSAKVQAGGIRCQELRDHADSLERDHLVEGIRFVLTEFLTVLGNLTAEILTPALHSELSKVAPFSRDERGPDERESRGEPQNPESRGEDAKS
ncbi:MAG: hypothetical protein HY698_14565 [Deltaproteobacteria bacterium]|nr:hypothetical protein [Deltaproteobacteria bacterium]